MASPALLDRVVSRLRRELGGLRAGEAAEPPAVDPLVAADEARREGRFADAAAAYDAALIHAPQSVDMLVQSGHMHKEAGQFEAAQRAYQSAAALAPDDADLALQLGHFYKVAGRLADAELSYRRAADLAPDHPAALIELDGMYRSGWRRHVRDPDGAGLRPAEATSALADVSAKLLPGLQPRSDQELLYAHHESIDVRRCGRLEPTLWGELRVLRGVEAIRGYCSSMQTIRSLEVKLGSLLLYKGPITGFPFLNERYRSDLRKWVFNVWLDFSGFSTGRYDLQLIFHPDAGDAITWREEVAVADVIDDEDARASDAFVPPFPTSDPRLLQSQINALPSMVRSCARPIFDAPVRRIAVRRTDQLGDLVLSVAALRRLREIFPEARLVGLLTGGNVALARTLGLFDEIISVDFPDVPKERRRVMTMEDQKTLKDRLAPFDFDIAIDMAESNVSRPLLLLTGARFTYGFRDREFAWMSAGFDCNTRDARNRLERVPHSAKLLGLVETLGAMLDTRPRIVRRPDLDRSRLAKAFGIGPEEGYAVLHAGARLEYSRWAGYPELAARLLAETPLKVVMLSDNPGERQGLPASLERASRFQLVDGKLDFDDFDALLSFCAVFVGNDSGPKHMASLRGAPVVSLQMARNNWSEWGQENTGLIVSRRVPCAGCVIQHEPQECGKDYACIRHIKPDEVFAAVQQLLGSPAHG